MIQRIQTIWLLLASIVAFLTLKFSFYSGHLLNDAQKQFISLSGSAPSMLITVLTVTVAVASLVLIFLFKDRKMQLRITIAVLVLSIINIVLYFLKVQEFVSTESSFDLTAVLVFVVPVFLILAARGIYKDNKLIKSVDRLR